MIDLDQLNHKVNTMIDAFATVTGENRALRERMETIEKELSELKSHGLQRTGFVGHSYSKLYISRSAKGGG